MSVAERVAIVALVAVTVVTIVVLTVRSYRHGGHGPRMRTPALSRRGRERTNRAYEQHGWAKPYDEQGRLLPVRERELPDGPSSDASDG